MVQCVVQAVWQSWLAWYLMKSLVPADPDSFPNIRILLVLACTLPVTSAETERSFSVFRLIKSHLRSQIADTRFSALTLMKIHYSKYIDFPKFADRFIKEHPKRLFKASLFDWCRFTWGNKYFKHYFFVISMQLE